MMGSAVITSYVLGPIVKCNGFLLDTDQNSAEENEIQRLPSH